MIKKLFKRGLSLLLALVLVVTTFFIFDPSLLKLDADAYVDVESVTQEAPLSPQSLYATETIYLKAGSSAFEYYENYDYLTGKVGSAVDTNGRIYFSNEDASAVYLVVNNVYEKGSSTAFSGKLTINGTAINTYANLANGSGTYTKGDIFAQTTGGTLDYKINSGSLTGCTEGKVCIIEWLIRYEIDGKFHLAFAYTGVYAPVLGQAGVTYNLGREYGAETLHQQGYSFLTGAMKYGGGNGKSNFTNPNVINVAGGIGSNKTFTAPLVSFVSYADDSSNFTVPGNNQVTDAYNSTTLFAQGTTNVGGGVLVSQQRYNKSESHLRTTWTSVGSYDNPNPTGTTTNNSESWSQTTGVGYVLVDSSRYTNYGQIPNLSLGWVQFGHYLAGKDTNGLHNISVLDANHNKVSSVNVIGFSSHDWDGSNGGSYKRGLFHIGGSIREGLTEFEFYATNRYNYGVGTASGDFYITVGLHTTTYNQSMLRQQYNTVLNSLVDCNNMTDYYSGTITYSSYYNGVKAAAEALVDPTQHTTDQITDLVDMTKGITDGINSHFAADVYFYVPEAIYTAPKASYNAAATHNGSIYINNTIDTNTNKAAVTAETKTYGTVFFSYSNAMPGSVKLSYTTVGAANQNDANTEVTFGDTDNATTNTTTLTPDSGNVALSSGQMKYITTSQFYLGATETGYWIKWKVDYVDENDGRARSVEAYTYVYRTFYIPIAANIHLRNTKGSSSGARHYNDSLTWVSGIHSIKTAGSYYSKTKTDYEFLPYWLVDSSSPSYFNFDARTGGEKNPDGWHLSSNPNDEYYHSGIKANINYKSYEANAEVMGAKVNSPTGELWVDWSRYKSLADVPGLHCAYFLPGSKNALSGAWVIGDFTGKTVSDGTYTSGNGSYERTEWYNYNGTAFGKDGYPWDDNGGFTTSADDTGVKYAGDIKISIDDKKLLATEKNKFHTFSIKACSTMDDAKDNNQWATAVMVCNFDVTILDKTKLREQLNYAINKSNELNPDYFNTNDSEGMWTAYKTAFENASKALTKVDGTVSGSYDTQEEIDALADTLKSAVDTLLDWNCSARKTGTAKVYHKVIEFNETKDSEGTVTGTLKSVANLNIGDNGSYIETKTFRLGENIYTGYNEADGYKYFGYYRSETGAEWKGNETKALSLITGDMSAQDAYGSTGENVDKYYAGTTLSYTYLYTKDDAGVYMDWGESELSFENKKNYVDVSKSEIDTAYTGDGTSYPADTETESYDEDNYYRFESDVAEVSVTKGNTDGFNFSIIKPGYNIDTPKATGLVNLFDFDGWGWDSESVNYATGTLTLTNNSVGERTTAFGGASRGIEGTGERYLITFDYKSLTQSAGDQVNIMWFTYAANDSSFGNWGGAEDNKRAGRTRMTIAPGSSGTYSIVVTPPEGYPNLSIRFELHSQTGNSKVEYSNIRVYDMGAISSLAKMNDIFLPGAATGLTSGKTYTVSFASSLRYDNYQWFATDMYGKHTATKDWVHNQGTIQVFISATKDTDDLYNYTVPVRVTTDITSGGTIGTFTMPEGCTSINLGFCITNDTPLAGWVENIRVVEGDYVEIGTAGQNYTLPDPQREGHSFTRWSQKNSPFNGYLSGSTYTYGLESDTVLASWSINKYDIVFDNEFRFDEYVWTGSGRETIDVDYATNTVTIHNSQAKSDGTYDSYAGAYNSTQTGRMILTPGHTYRLSFKLKNLDYSSDSDLTVQPYVFASADGSSYSGVISPQVSYTTETGTFPKSSSDADKNVAVFTVPAGKPYVAIRMGTITAQDVEFSDIYIQDITRGSGANVYVDDTVSKPQLNNSNFYGVVRNYKEPLINTEFTTLPTMTSDGYFFNGWYTEKTGGTQVTNTSEYLTQAGTNQLWSRWQVHIEYDLSKEGGAYLDDFTKPEVLERFKEIKLPETSDKYDVGATLTDVKIADYVPYKVGYNFAGWKDKFKGDIYQPGQEITQLNYSLILEPVWEAATDVTKDTVDYEEITELHPGQVYFYAYTPANNNELVSGYVYGSSPDLTVTLYQGNQKEKGDQPQTLHNEIYGVYYVNSIVTSPVTKGTEYYYGITAGNTAKVTVTGEKFKVSEHKVLFRLDGGDGGTPATQLVEGHYNTALVFEEPVRPGHSFKGWNTAANVNTGSEITTTYIDSLINEALKDTVENVGNFVVNQVMHAAWAPKTYQMGIYAYYNVGTSVSSVSAHQLGKTGGRVRFGAKSDTNKNFEASAKIGVVYGEQQSIEAIAEAGYTFKGWYDAPTFDENGNITSWGTVKYEDVAITTDSMPDHNVNLYARFDINTYAVTLRAYSDSSANPGVYNLSDVGGTVKLDNLEAGITATQTYVGKYMGESGTMVEPSYTMTAVPKAGYAFEGWYFGENALDDVPDNGNNPATIKLEKNSTSDHACDHTYTAKFSVQKSTLTANADGGTPNKIYEGYMGATVELVIPELDGYDFDGWEFTTQGGNAYGQIVDGVYTFGAGDDFATAKWKIQNYPITIDPVGGEVTVSYYYGDELNPRTQTFAESKVLEMAYMSTARIVNPTKTGYNFERWVETNNEGELISGQDAGFTDYKVGLNDKAVITATWTVIAYPLRVQAWGDAANLEGTYTNNKGGTVAIGETTGTDIELYVDYGTKTTLVATPETGYEFRGWSTAVPSSPESFVEVSTEATFKTEAMGTQGLNYYAVFEIKRYTVSVDAEYNTAENYETYVSGATGGTVKGGGTFGHGQSALIEAIPSTSYVFKGWYNGNEEVAVNPKYTVTVTKDVALTARFSIKEYTVSTTAVSNYANNPDQFDGNDAAGTFEGSNKYYHGLITNIEAKAASGYEFKGWYSDYELKNLVSSDEVLNVAVTGNVTYYAKFEVLKVGINLYAMSNSNLKNYTQNTNGGSVSFDNVTYAETASGECYFGGNYTVYAKPETGYTFDGWYTDESLSGTPLTGSYVDGYFSYLGTADNGEGVELYAKFSVGAYELNAYAYSNSGSGITNYDNNNVGGVVNIKSSYIVAGSEKNEGNGAHLTVKVYYNKKATITATPKPGYKFVGWYTDRALEKLLSAGSKVETQAMGVNGLNYYAKFDVDSFTIVYNANGGVNIQNSTATAYYNTAFTVAPEIPTWAGHTFIGWSSTADGPVEYQPGATILAGVISDWYSNKGGTATLYAQWTLNANFLIATSAYSKANGVYYVDKKGEKGGTVTVLEGAEGEFDENAGLVVIPEGQVIESYLKFEPATGYALSHWCYSHNAPPADGEKINSTWGNDGTRQTTMPANTTYVVAFFLIKTFNAEAKAYYNTAANPDRYNYGVTGGTVKLGQTGANVSNAVSETKAYGTEVLFVATAARGYDFSGWYSEPENNNGVVNKSQWNEKNFVEDSTENKVKLKDDSASGDPTANNYYAVFSIKAFKATAIVRTYTVREDLIYSIPDNEWPDGMPLEKGGKVGLGLTSASDDTWEWSGVDENGLYPSISQVYYGQKVYFKAVPNPGYFFGGWYAKSSLNEKALYFGDALVEEELTTYSQNMRDSDMFMEAKFVPVSFTLVLDANGGVEGNPIEVILTYNNDGWIDPTSTPTKTSSTFVGWSESMIPEWDDTMDESTLIHIPTIPYGVVNMWFEEIYDSETDSISNKTVYAVWKTSYISIKLEDLGATGGIGKAETVVGKPLPSISKDDLPTYEGFVFGGYYESEGGTGVKYYNADGSATAAVWNNNAGGTIYALWTCPVLESIDYNKATGEWVYTYREENGGKIPVESETAAVSAAEITAKVAGDSSLMWWTKNADQLDTTFVTKQIEKTPEINLNHYSNLALTDLHAAVTETNTSEKLGNLTQPQANAYVARMAKDMELDFEANNKGESEAPTIRLYETASKVDKIRDNVLAADSSVIGKNYPVPTDETIKAASYAYAGKWSYTEQKAVDYYLYTNSPNPVIALEIGDGEVASTVDSNSSSYPTKATVTDNAASFGYVNSDYTMSAVKAADNLDKAWFTQYTNAGIGTAHDYNAKTVVYLTPEFTSSGTQNEIVYTIKASDDAYVPNEGVKKSELSVADGQSLANMQARFGAYKYDITQQEDGTSAEKVEDITICICYHNAMNGDSDEGTLDASGPYMQMYLDQVNIDKYINQLHLLRNSGGAANHDFPTTGESVYPVEDKNYPYSETGCVLGSFMYVFDATNEPEAVALASAGTLEGYSAAKDAIISSVNKKASDVKLALENRGNKLNIHGSGTKLGFAQIVGWSGNFSPKTGSYVYVHLVDRWGNVFNRVWECHNVDSYPSTILAGGGTAVYNIFEDGGSSIDTMNLDGANVEFILDDNSSYENGVFTTTGNTVSIATGEANKTYSLTVTDKATNTNTVEVTTDGDGVLVLNVEDACADLSAGAYSFTLNGETVNLYSGVEKLVYSAAITEISQVGMETVVTVKTSKDVVKLQLVEGIATRTYTREVADSVVENEDGTLTWTLKLKPSKGVHSYALKAKNLNGWETTEYTLTTEVIDEYVSTPVALKSVYNAKVEAGEKPVIEAKTLAGTQKLQLVYSSGATITYNRSDDIVISTVDGVETWALTSSAFSKTGEYEVKVRAKYNNEWQDAGAKISTVTVTEKSVDKTPAILSVEAQSASAKIYDYVTFKVVTNSYSTKIRFNKPDGSTWTFAEKAENTVVNADGTKTWTVAVKFYAVGENDITFSTRDANGWVEAQNFGTIEITK